MSIYFFLSVKFKYIDWHHSSSKTTLLFSCISSLPLSCRSLYFNLVRKGKKFGGKRRYSAGNGGIRREGWFHRRFFTDPYCSPKYLSILTCIYHIVFRIFKNPPCPFPFLILVLKRKMEKRIFWEGIIFFRGDFSWESGCTLPKNSYKPSWHL